MSSELVKKVANVLKKSELTFGEQVATIACIEYVLLNMNAAAKNDIGTRYGQVALRALLGN